MPHDVEIAVLGAGVVGCAVARALARRGHDVWVLEAASRPGTGISSRNSGVIHAGIQDPPSSLRTRACVEGRRRLVAYCRARAVPHRVCGKFVVAHTRAQVEALEGVLARAHAAGVTEARPVSPGVVVARAPCLRRPLAALLVPVTGIVDPHALVSALGADVERAGGKMVFACKVAAIELAGAGFTLRTSRGPVTVRRLVNAAGLGAAALARSVAPHAPPVHPCRGDYVRLRRPPPLDLPVYPVRTPGDPGLGLHLTPDLHGDVRLGPSAYYVDEPAALGGAPDLGPFVSAARTLLAGEVSAADLAYVDCGIRPKLRGRGERAERDFLLLEDPPGALHLLGIESPGLTAALALGRIVADWARGGGGDDVTRAAGHGAAEPAVGATVRMPRPGPVRR